MSKDKITITYQGFSPSEYVQDYIFSIMEEITNEAPASTKLKVSFVRKDTSIKGAIHLYSAAGSFFSTAISTHSVAAAEKMLKLVRRRINKWKTKNHERVSLKNLELNSSFYQENRTLAKE